MLDFAINHQESLNRLFRQSYLDSKYHYANCSSFADLDFSFDKTTWTNIQCASLLDNQVIGYLSAKINRETYSVDSLYIASYDDHAVSEFGKDLRKFLKDLFVVYKFNKIGWSVVIGNNVEINYDRMIQRLNGRIVGILKNDVKLINGTICDRKLYEVTLDEYTNRRGRINPP